MPRPRYYIGKKQAQMILQRYCIEGAFAGWPKKCRFYLNFGAKSKSLREMIFYWFVQGGKKGSRRKGYAADVAGEENGDGKRAALEEMVTSYKEREERAMGDAEVLKEQARDAKLKNRALFDR